MSPIWLLYAFLCVLPTLIAIISIIGINLIGYEGQP